ncbi:MAG: hypothetical protein AB1679_25800 [Actinomycetota bacterium]|jgi:hypothetical protein
MKRKKVVRNVTLATLATGVVAPLSGLGADAAAAGPSPAALCSSTFGDRGPAGGKVVGEGPPGDSMTVTIGWEPADWPDGLREVVTCLSIDGKAVPGLARLTTKPPNAGNIAVDLRLPPGAPGALVCQNSILVGTGATEGRQRSTGAVCFKLRAAEELLAGPETATRTTPPAGTEPVRIPNTHPSGPPAAPRVPAGQAAAPAPAPSRTPAPMPSSTPPARAAFEAARGAARSPQAWSAPPARPASARPAPARPAPAAPSVTRAGQAADELARTPSVGDRTAAAAAAPTARAPRGTVATAGAPAASGAPGPDAARSALPRTGVGDKIPLAGAGTLMALGGAAIILGEPRRRVRRPA